MSQTTQSKDSPGVIMPPPLIFVAGLAMGWALQWLWPVRVFPGRPFEVAGWLVAVLSGVLALWGAWTMRRAGTNIDPRKPALAVVTSGPFRFTRNPLYLSLVLLSVGLALFFDMVWVLVMLIPVVYVMQRYVIRREERYLEVKFGDAYRQYKQNTRRWV
jgi:protein-S-isoprenylcysteine O-methyltransferase Ste14